MQLYLISATEDAKQKQENENGCDSNLNLTSANCSTYVKYFSKQSFNRKKHIVYCKIISGL